MVLSLWKVGQSGSNSYLLKQEEGIPLVEECSKDSPVRGLSALIITKL